MTRLEKDIESLLETFPKLKLVHIKENRWLKGEIDICDVKGIYWDTFTVAILIPANYPYGVPVLYEPDGKIERGDERHVNKQGVCCVDMDHELAYQASKGISLEWFIRQKVYPFFANQLHYEREGSYTQGEYKHEFDGVRQFYSERLNINDDELAIHFLDRLLNNSLPERNDQCPCNSGEKYKNCHEVSLKYLKHVERGRLLSDLKGFKAL